MTKRNLLRILFLLSLIPLSHRLEACHGVALIGFSASTNGSSVTVNGSSDPATCGCGPYYMEVEIACFSASNFTGNAPSCTATNWNVYPWYRSILNVPNYTAANNWPDNCVTEPYFPVTIPFTDLCPGTQYVLRARERVCGSGSGGPWSATYTFTTPGTPPNFTLTAAANPTSVCPGNPVTLTATLNGSGGCGTGTPIFTWNPGNLVGQTVTVTPTVTTVYTVTCTGGYVACYPVTPATVTVTVTPTTQAGTASVSSGTVCAGGCVTLTLVGNSGTIQWQSSPNGVTWTNIAGATTSPYTYCPVNSLMYFHAIVTGGPGCGNATSNTVSVGVTPVPNLTITPANPTICAGQSVTLNVTGGSGYTWTGPNSFSATGPSITISPTVTGTYSVSTSGNCPGTKTVTVTVNPLPVITFSPPSASICAGTSVTIDAGASTNNYVWTPNGSVTPLSPSSDSVSVSPSSTTTYNVTATTAAGCSASGTITVTINPIPTLLLSDTVVYICPNMTDTVTINGASTYTWTPLTGAQILNANGSQVAFAPASSTTYTVIGTSAAGCVDSTTLPVIVTNNIIVDAGLPDSICPGTSINLNGTGGTQYTWSASNPTTIVNGNTATPTVSPTVTTTFTVNVANQYGCTGSDSVTIFVRPAPVANAGVDTSFCAGGSVTLNGSGGGQYGWSGTGIVSGSTTATPTVAPFATSDYVLLVTDAAGCTDIDSVNVIVRSLPVASAGPDVSICGNNCASLLATGGTQYQWTPATWLSSPNTAATQACPPASATYTVQVTDQYGCVNYDTIKVIVNPPLTVTASLNDSICPGGSSSVSATASGGNGGPYTYAWAPAAGLATPNAQSSTATPSVTTTYTVTINDSCGSLPVVDSVTIVVYPIPQLNVTPDITSGCSPVCVTFSGTSNPAAASNTYNFGDNSTSTSFNPTHCYNTAGTYTITYDVTDIHGCTNTATFPNMISVWPNPVAGFSVSPQTTSVLTGTVTITPNCTSCDTTTYTFTDSTMSPVTNLDVQFDAVFTNPGTFTITQYAINQYGCIDSTTEVVIIQPDWSFYAPNAFTPNGDLHNDVFYVFGEGIDQSTFRMYIYDRWGNQVFVTDDISKGWDGHINSGPQPGQIDTYVWKVTFRDINGDPHTYVGHVNMVR